VDRGPDFHGPLNRLDLNEQASIARIVDLELLRAAGETIARTLE
jgi:hypothetical protein